MFSAIERAGVGRYDYRATVGPWFRSLFVFQPDTARMAAAPVDYQVHTVIGMLLFMPWPFTRLVHAFTAPAGYLFRPYLAYRSRDVRRTAARGWSPVGTPDRR
ncbi:respiratory nitrate reductase subunit gamma [Actinocatenispora rupis]|uniref:respiratory nitrate reductase subunit gamma n=1 Tax=Actinocatenispora rupis TaxID=519421 RepID=UPI001EF3387B|nr:respiratory nitrate reductase subunit gamma [Actinocatenispora rupis]